MIHLELKETIYIVQEGNVNLLTKLKGDSRLLKCQGHGEANMNK